MEQIKAIVAKTNSIQRIIKSWTDNIVDNKQYTGIEPLELSKYYEIKIATQTAIKMYNLDNSDKITDYKRRKISLYIAKQIIDRVNKINELKRELSC